MHRITIERKDEEAVFECDKDDTLLRAALRAGIGFPYSCNVGSCGNCRFELLNGSVTHQRIDPPAWSERDLKRNRYLGCQALPGGDCRIKFREDAQYIPPYMPEPMQGRFVEKIDLTHDISEFVFELDGPRPFLPGQYALIHAPGVSGGRVYSMSNVPDDENRWHFQIKRVPDGAATGYLFDTMQVGDEITLDGPYGIAYLQPDAPRDILCIAGGSGLSPIMSISRAAALEPALRDRQIDVIYGGRTAKDICGESILAEAPGYGKRLHFHPVVSDPEADQGQWQGPTGFVHEYALAQFGEALASREIYFAGPPAMAQAMQRMLFEAGVPSEQVHFDEFY